MKKTCSRDNLAFVRIPDSQLKYPRKILDRNHCLAWWSLQILGAKASKMSSSDIVNVQTKLALQIAVTNEGFVHLNQACVRAIWAEPGSRILSDGNGMRCYTLFTGCPQMKPYLYVIQRVRHDSHTTKLFMINTMIQVRDRRFSQNCKKNKIARHCNYCALHFCGEVKLIALTPTLQS